MSQFKSGLVINLFSMAALALVGCGHQTVVPSASAQAPADQLGEDEGKGFAQRCKAMNAVDLERAGDNPGRVVRTELVEGRKASPRQRIMFKKRGHSQGNPMPEEEMFPDHCLVEGYVTPHVQFAMMLPDSGDWNGRFMLAACDGWCGKVHSEITVPGLHKGYATLTNNGGHYSRAPFDGIWAHDDVRAREYFAYKANHVTAQAGKAIIKAFYGEPAKYSYISGFSKGGNAGLMAAQRYPEDFDGIFVKAPVVNYNAKNAAHFTWTALAVLPDGKTPLLKSDKTDLINKGVLKACDGIDGVENGVIDDPRQCDFDPVALLCKSGQSEEANECLNAAQVDAVRKLYQAPTTANGEVYYPYIVDRGSEFDWARALLPVPGSLEPGTPFSLSGAATGLRYMAMIDNPGPDYDWRGFDYTKQKKQLEPMSKILDPDSTDLQAFHARGGKIMIVHGWSDAMITASMTIDWFDKMTRFMGGEKKLADFAQLYIVPGMVHGSGGAGPYVFDAQSSLVDWVEKGVVPQELMMQDEPAVKPMRQRAMYPYPAISVYKGAGDPNLASSYKRAD